MDTAISAGITILGLGPGDASLLTRQAWDELCTISEVVLRTRQHPAVADFPPSLKIVSFDELYDHSEESCEAVYEKIIEKVLELGQRPQGVTYAVPGQPFIAEATAPEIARRARKMGIPLRVIEGVSFLEPSFTALGLDPLPQTTLADAMELSMLHHPPFPPDAPALIAQVDSPAMAAKIKLTLKAVYPDAHLVKLIHAAGTPQQVVEDLPLSEIDESEKIGALTSLYLPPLAEGTSLEAFEELIAHLRAPDGCPWDRKQTHETLRKHLLEETYETLEAMDSEDPAAMCEEFGDLLLQIVLNAQIGWENDEFTMADILKGIYDKIVRRHPHVFGDVEVDGVSGVLQNWEKLKAKERKDNGTAETKGLLDGVPKVFPALAQSHEYQDRAARVGFDWKDVEGVYAKVEEELAEVRSAPDEAARGREVGDLLFSAVNLARWLHVDAEAVLRETNVRFRTRFTHIEDEARQRGVTPADLSLEEMDRLWEEAKEEEE